MPGAAEAKPSLAQAVRQLDGKYLNAPQPPKIDDSTKIEAGGSDNSKPQQISAGGITAKITFPEAKQEGGGEEASPLVTVLAGGQAVASVDDGGMGNMFPFNVQIAELDPDNDTPEVVVSFYTGGAHCCSDTSVVTKAGKTWKTVAIGQFDGGPLTAADLNGDGVYEFEVSDPAFAYAFGCYACTTKPLKIIAVRGGEAVTVSAEPQFRKVQAYWMKSIVGAAPEDGSGANAFLAGYVGQAALLGEGESAWKLMLKYYDRKDDWGLEVCPTPEPPQGACPVKEITVSFPAALQRLLRENGYKIR